jgi:hypothetical protein
MIRSSIMVHSFVLEALPQCLGSFSLRVVANADFERILTELFEAVAPFIILFSFYSP